MNLTDFSGQRPIFGGYKCSKTHTSLQVRTLSSLELLGLASTTNTTSESSERDDLLVLRNVAEVGVRLGQLETYNITPKTAPSISPLRTDLPDERTSESSGHFAHVLEVGAEVLPAGPRSCTQPDQPPATSI